MCEKIRELLEQWSVAEDIIKEFERNDMKVDILQYLTDDDIKTLIPKIGAQILFRKKLKDFLNRENNQIKESNEIRSEKNILHKEKDNAENESSFKNTNIIIDTDKNQCATAQSLFVDINTIAWNEHDFNGMEMSILGEESGNDVRTDKESIFHNFEESPRKKQKLFSENFLTDQKCLDPNESLMSNKTGESGINETATLKDVEKSTQEYNYLTGRESDYDLEHVLKDSVKGHTVLSAYLFQGELDEKHRNILADIIVHHELRDNLNFRVTSERAEFIAEKIIKLFPKEEKDTWILREKNRKGKSVGRGKILIKFQTIRRNLIKSGAIKESKKQSKNEEEREEIDDYCEDADCEQYILWLQNNDKPWIKVTQLWEKTSKIRLKSLQSSNQNIQDYIKLYSALEEPQGYTLLEKDFEKLYPEAHMKLYAEWAKLSAFIEQKVAKIDPKFKTHSNPDKKTVQLLSKLPSLFPVYTAIVGKGKGCNWRPSLCERREAFLWRIETYGDLKAKIKERREKLNHFKLTLQPQAVIIGSSETDIRHSIVIIDKIHYEVETPLKAIDIAFKCIYSLHAEYPKESEQVYLFLQTGIYGISTKYDKKFSAVSTLIKEYKNFSL